VFLAILKVIVKKKLSNFVKIITVSELETKHLQAFIVALIAMGIKSKFGIQNST
jgi:predicted transcriptional regulator